MRLPAPQIETHSSYGANLHKASAYEFLHRVDNPISPDLFICGNTQLTCNAIYC